MNIRSLLGPGSVLVAFCMLFAPQALMAQEEKPFAEHKFVLQISDMDPSKQTLVLNVANNILKAYGTDQVDVGLPQLEAVAVAAHRLTRAIFRK